MTDNFSTFTIDLETTMKCPVGNNKANPYWPDNNIVLAGLKTPEQPNTTLTDKKSIYGHTATNSRLLVIGHHIGFDLGYLYRTGAWDRNLVGKQDMIWDTQLAAYLISGQQHKWASLDELAMQKGLPVKDTSVADMFAVGKGADEVPVDKLSAYLRTDVENTEAIALKQMATVTAAGYMPFYAAQMDALLATVEMTHNGLMVDKAFLEAQALTLAQDIEKLEREWQAIKALRCYTHTLNPFAPQQLSKMLFGGKVKRKEKQLIGKYKNGKDKFKIVEVEVAIRGTIPATEHNPEWKGANGLYSTDDSVLHTLLANPKRGGANKRVIQMVLNHREKNKQLTTYFDAVHKLIMPDGYIHHKLNHCATVTGRLSGSEPNMQNQSKDSPGNIKKAFISRWGEYGVILEADYKQLEMVALAVISGDAQLIEDISLGRDIHTELFMSMHSRIPTETERWSFKRCSFALVYGAGKKAIAEQGGTTVEEAAKFIKVFYNRYPGVKVWHDTMIAWADSARVYEGDKDKDTGLPIGKAYYKAPTGRTLVFKEYPLSPEIKKWKGKECGFSPTELKNYPPQSLATGDLVPLVLGKLLRVLKNDPDLADKCLMINTVHDSVIFDVHKDVLVKAAATIRRVMEHAHIYMEETFGMKFPLPLKVEISVGPNWGEQEKLV